MKKIHLIMESKEEGDALKRYIMYCLNGCKIKVSLYIYNDIKDSITKLSDENPDITIVGSHYEDSSYPLPHLSDRGYWVIRSYRTRCQLVLVLYESFENTLPSEWQCFLRIPWQNIKISERIKTIMEQKIIPADEEIEELNKLYPPIIKDSHHPRRHYGSVW